MTTTATPDGSRPLSESSRHAVGVGLCREQTRLNRIADACTREIRPAFALGGDDFRKLINERYEAMMARCGLFVVKLSPASAAAPAADESNPVEDAASVEATRRARRRNPAFAPA